ncbi:MAG TPA: hypothetical protein VEA99_21170, partial [Gemmatimonadaceae bacterium]|nr:hypothetical protein [Gemmatimonadaceae bacterium]
GFLWGQRRRALRSPLHSPRALAQLDERIEAHADGLTVLGDDLGGFVEPALEGEDEAAVFAAAFALLRRGDAAALARVRDRFASADGPPLAAVAEALRHGNAAPLHRDLLAAAERADGRGALALEVLAFRGVAAPPPDRLAYLAGDDLPTVRASAWRAAGHAGVALPPARYEAALGDDDPTVRSAALEAALWARHPGLLALCRGLAERPTKDRLDGIVTYAAVAGAEEMPWLGPVLRDRACGPARLRVAGAFGHPAFIEPLLALMSNGDPATAAAAGAAFEKITGESVESDTRATVPPEGAAPDAFEAEFLDEVTLPDPAKAREAWAAMAPRLAGATRICRGHDMARGLDREAFAALDMESRWELCARARLAGQWQGTAAATEAFPIRP